MKNKTQQLLILGNGFDLTCGLNSRYSDFLNSRPNLPTALGTLPSQSNDINIWDYIIQADINSSTKHFNSNWSGIEETIKEWILTGEQLQPNAKIFPVSKSHIQRMADDLIHLSSNPSYSYNLNPSITEYYPTQWLSILPEFHGEQIKGKTGDEVIALIRRYLIQQLNKYEKLFMKYLEHEVDNKKYIYLINARIALNNLIHPHTLRGLHSHDLDRVAILNFNYTMPFASIKLHEFSSKNLQDQFFAYQNVHGNLQYWNGFFGIDGRNLLDDLEVLPFTKTYQLMNNESLFSNPTILFHSNYSQISIFGHSLNSADYSYFQSIFDDVDLYDSNTKITVFYSPVVKDDKQIKSQQLIKLLYEYGRTLDNKDHGMNLVHKLLLENRLHVEAFFSLNLNPQKPRTPQNKICIHSS